MALVITILGKDDIYKQSRTGMFAIQDVVGQRDVKVYIETEKHS